MTLVISSTRIYLFGIALDLIRKHAKERRSVVGLKNLPKSMHESPCRIKHLKHQLVSFVHNPTMRPAN